MSKPLLLLPGIRLEAELCWDRWRCGSLGDCWIMWFWLQVLLHRLTLEADIGGGGGGIDGGAGIDGGELADSEDVEDLVEELELVLERVERRVRLN